MSEVTSAVDPWPMLRRHTAARIGLGRAGDSLPTARLLEFESAHARARDAVHAAVDFAAITARLGDLPTIPVRSAAPDRAIYLQRPDLGRRLDSGVRPLHTDRASRPPAGGLTAAAPGARQSPEWVG